MGPGDIRQYLEMEALWLVWEGHSSTWWVEARDAAEHPTTHRTVPTTENCLTQNVSSIKVEKL